MNTSLTLHLSTICALEAMQSLHEGGAQFSNIADIGCGGGALSLQAAVFWPQAQILASDISEAAIADAKANIAQLALAQIETVRADGYDHPEIRQRAPFDLVLCNLLAEHQVRLARDLAASLAPGGIAILSGILPWLLEDVTRAHVGLGLEPIGRIESEQWMAIILINNNKYPFPLSS